MEQQNNLPPVSKEALWYFNNYILLKDYYNRTISRIAARCIRKGNIAIEEYPFYGYILDVLEERFGEEKAQQLIEEYQNNWITEQDIRTIAKAGCNVVRVPFWYRNFMKDADGTWLTEKLDDNPGIKRLDWVIETARQYRIYVILDMHGCPGGQSYNHSTGAARTCELFSNTHYQDVMEELWVAIAERYKDNPAVAAYDIMNEAQEYSGEIGSDHVHFRWR